MFNVALALGQASAQAHEKVEEEQSLYWLERTAARRPESLQVQKLLGAACYRAGKTNEAIEHYRQIIERRPHDLDALESLADLEMSMGQLPLASLRLRDALAVSPNDPEVLYRCAQLARREGRPQDARKILEKILAEHPGHERAQAELASLGR